MVRTRRMVGVIMTVTLSLMAGALPCAAEVVDRIVAIVNNDIICLSELNKATRPFKENIAASNNSEDKKQALLEKLNSDMLTQLVEKSLATQEAKKHGISVTDEDIDRAIENFKIAKHLDDAGLNEGLAREGLTLDEYRRTIKDQIQQSRLINRAVRSKVIITDQDVSQYYTAHKQAFSGTRKLKLRNILTRTEQDIKQVETRLAGGTSFADLAKTASIGSNASEGGALGLFDISSFSAEIAQALNGLKKGEYTPVLPMENAYQIIYVEDIVMEGSMSLDQAKNKILDILSREQGQKMFREWMDALKKNALIKLML